MAPQRIGAAVLGLVALLGTPVAFGGVQDPGTEAPVTAPDGKPGLVGRGGARDLGKLLRSPRGDGELALVRGLHGLPTELAISLELLKRAFEQRGYFGLLLLDEPREPGLLFARHAELGTEAAEVLRGGDARAERFAHMDADLAPRVAAIVLEDHEVDLADLTGGLALLLATAEGHVWLEDDEARAIAARVDLAAAHLRARVTDLEVLARGGVRTARHAGAMIGAAELLDTAAVQHPDVRRRRLGELRAALEREAGRLAADLATPRLRARCEEALKRRDASRSRARELLVEVRRLAPYTPEGAEASAALAGLANFQRYGLARRSALEALGLDPLFAEHAYHVGRVTHFLDDEHQARGWLDRFLALQRIRTHQEASYTARELTDAERFALDVVQRFSLPR